MKKTLYAIFAAAVGMVAIAMIPPATPEIHGTWKIIKAQYGNEPLRDYTKETDLVYKTFTTTRWTGVFYNLAKKTFAGSGGGTYTLKENQYRETVEYYSWDPEAVGKTFVFTMTLEKGLLHQKGFIEYKGNPEYVIDEWYTRID
ncbi:MAG: hypothetical protein WDN75_07815 [Bacteroidota bacterium]